MLIQLAKNAVVHGIEESGERKKKNKPETGSIILTGYIKDNVL